jgi:hypothetical protein
VSGKLPDTFSEKPAESASDTPKAPEGKVSGVYPTPCDTLGAKDPVELCRELAQRNLERPKVIAALAATFPTTRHPDMGTAQERVTARWTRETFGGVLVADADAEHLRADTIGLAAWTLDRRSSGSSRPRELWQWIEAARAALFIALLISDAPHVAPSPYLKAA